MNRPVKQHVESEKALPFVFRLFPRGKMTFNLPYMIPIVSDIEAVDIDIYVPTGKTRTYGKADGRIYVYDDKLKKVKNQLNLTAYQYRYKYSICNTESI